MTDIRVWKQAVYVYMILNGMNFEYFTCDDCNVTNKCDLAYDPYNTDGDCLYDK